MTTKNFQKYIEKRLTKEEIVGIEKDAELEVKKLRSTQKCIKFEPLSNLLKSRTSCATLRDKS